MADITVEILADNTPRYLPTNVLQHGDTVTFRVDGTRKVTVSFVEDSCLTSAGPFQLDGTSPDTAASPPLAVDPSATKGAYYFSVTPVGERQARDAARRGELEAKQGELDVSTDPPKEVEG